jgi:hypothetical protein
MSRAVVQRNTQFQWLYLLLLYALASGIATFLLTRDFGSKLGAAR